MNGLIAFHREGEPLYWTGCYGSGTKWKRYVDPATVAHPAKMSFRLLSRILDHLRQLKLTSPDTTIIDFMAGTGRTAIEATRRGHRAMTVELEPKFVDFQRKNKAQMEKALKRDVGWEILQGDARKLSEIITGGGAGVVSPPYGHIAPEKNGPGIDKRKQWETYGASGGGMSFEGFCEVQARHSDGYGETAGNIGNMPEGTLAGVTSPPYMDSFQANRITPPTAWPGGAVYTRQEAGNSPGQLGAEKEGTYWEAMAQVYRGAFLSGISPLVTVTKDPTRNWAIVPLGERTASVLQSVGYRVIDYHRAVLFTERTQTTLYGEERKSVKGSVSFFKRISMAKGVPASKWEDVLIAIIPEGARCPIP